MRKRQDRHEEKRAREKQSIRFAGSLRSSVKGAPPMPSSFRSPRPRTDASALSPVRRRRRKSRHKRASLEAARLPRRCLRCVSTRIRNSTTKKKKQRRALSPRSGASPPWRPRLLLSLPRGIQKTSRAKSSLFAGFILGRDGRESLGLQGVP
jgi:hypothetical protein